MRAHVAIALCCTLLLSITQFSAAQSENGRRNILDITPDNFDEHVNGGRNVAVLFYRTTGCLECAELEPEYELVADAFERAGRPVVIARVNAGRHGPLARRFQAEAALPEVILFPRSKPDYVKLTSTDATNADAIVAWLNKAVGSRAVVERPPPAYVELEPDNFDRVVGDKERGTFVFFYASWCRACRIFWTRFRRIAEAFRREDKCTLAAFNAHVHKSIGQIYAPDGYPNIKIWPRVGAAKGTPVQFPQSELEVEDVLGFINEHCGTDRRIDGSLGDTAGRMADFDELAHEFATAPDGSDARAAAKEKLVAAAKASSQSEAKEYARVAAGILREGVEYYDGERRRLEKRAEHPNLDGYKRDEAKVKLNILRAFAAVKPK